TTATPRTPRPAPPATITIKSLPRPFGNLTEPRARFKKLGKVEQSRLLLIVSTPPYQGVTFLAGGLSFLFVEQRVAVRIHPVELARATPVEGAQHPRQRFTVLV
ncbi:hypothetical protein, partial [Streptomyces sp. NPDC057580]|uniref:hypothetical protein n=1 Tax=Streptomyces sp. NPDC057580 TaxID=3346173 RepID=UPI0036AFB457